MSDMSGFINVPSGRRLEELKTTIRVLPRATAKALEKARRTWPEARANDFERKGKLWVDEGSDIAYRRVPGDPLAAVPAGRMSPASSSRPMTTATASCTCWPTAVLARW